MTAWGSSLGEKMQTEIPVHLISVGLMRVMAVLAWESLRHPLSTSVVDLTTGRVLSRF
jgi:hypothetical protein